MTEPGPWPPVGGAPGRSAPVPVQFAGPARQDRWTVLFRAILAIPALVCLYFARYAAWVVLVAGWFGALFTGRLPDYAASQLNKLLGRGDAGVNRVANLLSLAMANASVIELQS